MKADPNLIALTVLRSATLEMIDGFPVRMSRYRVRSVRAHAFMIVTVCYQHEGGVLPLLLFHLWDGLESV
jgi:hypothetical protein